jgi:hypothetical protein
MRELLRLGTLSLLTVTLSTPALYAQVSFATVQGSVTDEGGAAIAGATVTVTNSRTGVVTALKTNSRGFYNFAELQIGGPYTVSINAPGFNQFKSTGLMLNLNDNRSVDAKLAVGQTSESVTVTANNGQVETADTQLKNVIDSKQIEQLPLLGGDASGLQKLQAGSVESSDRFGTYSANGSQTASNSFILDGIDINDGPLQTEGLAVTEDALDQETIVTSTLNPEFARNSGAVVNQVIKSGSNQFHGDAFEFYRDTFLNNGDYFSLPGQRPPFHQNRYGGTLGGPLVKDKLFFFLAYQGIRNKTGSTTDTAVPSAAQLGGAFGALTGSSATATTPFAIGNCPAGSPWSKCFGNGQAIPTSAFNPISAKLVANFVPAANTSIAGTPYYSFSTSNTGAGDQGVIRLDYNVTSKDLLWASTIFQSSPSTETLPFTGATLPGFGEVDAAHFKLFSANYTHTFSSSLLNDLAVNYYRFDYAAVEPQQNVQPSSYGFNITPQSPSAGLPYIGIQGFFDLGFSTNGPQPRLDGNLRGSDTVTLVKGNHTLKFGASVEQFRVSNPFFGDNNGAFAYGGGGTYSSGNPLADFLLGIPDSYAQGSGGFIDALAYENYFYAQDSWKATQDLVLNYGAGLDIETPNKDRQYGGLGITCFSLSSATTSVFQGVDAPPGLLYPGDPGCNSYGGTTVKYDHVAPRFGFAYSPSSGPGFLLGEAGRHNLSVRGGFGIYYNRDQEEGSLQNLSVPPFSLTSHGAADQGLTAGFANPYADVASGAAIANPFPFTPGGKGAALTWSNYTPLDINAFSQKYNIPFVMNFNLNVQRELPSNIVLQLAYVGSLGRRLVIAYEGDPITPAGHAACVADTTGCGSASSLAEHLNYPNNASVQPAINPANGFPYYLSVGTQGTIGSSNYNSAQVTVTKQATHGLQFTLAYTYSKALDDGSGLESSGFNGRGYNQYPGGAALNYGPSDYDARQRLVSSIVYEVPVFHSSNYLLREGLSGWQVAAITAVQTGFPINFTEEDTFRSKWCDEYSYYSCPDTPEVSTFSVPVNKIRSTGTYFNAGLFSAEPLGTFGNVGRGLLHGPGFNYSNVSVAKNFPLSADGVRSIQIRMDASNVFNHANFAAPDSNFGDQTFGQVSATLGSGSADPNADPTGGRTVQLVGRVYF